MAPSTFSGPRSTDHLALWLTASQLAVHWRELSRDVHRFPGADERRRLKRNSEAAAARARRHRDLALAGPGPLPGPGPWQPQTSRIWG